VKESKKRFSVLVPRSQPFDESAREALLTLAGRREGLLEQLPSYYSVLPPGAVTALRHAEAVDRLATARLAERLADGRGTAGMSAAAVIAAQPSWLTESAVAEDLWRAVAIYASQHNCFAEAGKAFGQAADCEGAQTTRSLAEAGLAFIASDRQAARLYLDRARQEGQSLLADIGLSLLAIPEGHGTPPEIPESVRIASSEELQAEPVALVFLADAAGRRGDLTKAVEYAERAVKCAGDRDTVTRFQLAQSIHHRALVEDMTNSEFRRALSYTLEGSYSPGVSAGGSHAPVVNNCRSASSLSRPHFVAVSR
jgi:tetratricopeptide (TPR) repeat protein